MEIITENAEKDFREAERRKLTPTVTTLKRTRYYTTKHDGICVTTEIKEYTKKTTFVYPDGNKPPELDNISLKSNCVQEKSKVSKKFTPIGNDELDALIATSDPFDLSRLDTDSHTNIYNLEDDKISNASSFTSRDFQITSATDPMEMETGMNQPGKPKLKFGRESGRESPGPETCKLNRLSFNKALKDGLVHSDPSQSSSSSSSSSSASAHSQTFKDTSDEKSDGTHKSSFFPKFFNICRGPDTRSVDMMDPEEDIPMDRVDCEEESLPSSVRSSVKVSRADHLKTPNGSVHDDSKVDTKTKSESKKPTLTSKTSTKPVGAKKPKMAMCPPFGKKPKVESPMLSRQGSVPSVHSISQGTDFILEPVVEPTVEPTAVVDTEWPELAVCADMEPIVSSSSLDVPAVKIVDLPDLAREEVPEVMLGTSDLNLPSIKSDSGEHVDASPLYDVPEIPAIPDTKSKTSSPVQKSGAIDIHPKAVRLNSDKKKRPFNLCGLGKPDLSEESSEPRESSPKVKPVKGPSRSCFGGQPSTIHSDGDSESDKDDTLKDGHSLCSNDSFALSSAMIRPPQEPSLTPRQLQVGINPDGSMMVDEDGCLLDPHGNPLIYIGPDGSDDPKFNSNLGPIIGPDGTVFDCYGLPIITAEGVPLLVGLRPVDTPADLIAVEPDENGNLLGPDGLPLLDAEGKPIKALVEVCVPYISPDGVLHGADKQPMCDPETGQPIVIALNPDGSLPLNEDGNLVDVNGDVVKGPDGRPLKPGEDPFTVVILAPDGGVIGPDGKPVLNAGGTPVKTSPPCGDRPLVVNDVGELLDVNGNPVVFEDIPVCPCTTYNLPDIGPDGEVFDLAGLPVISAEGVPVLIGLRPDPKWEPKMVPMQPDQSGNLLGPDGLPLLGPDGKPIACPLEVGCPHISPDGVLLGPDGTPLLDSDGNPIKLLLNPDGSLPVDEEGNLLDPEGNLILGPDGTPLRPGSAPLGDVIIAPDGTVLGPDGKPLLDADGNPIKVNEPLLDADGNPIKVNGPLKIDENGTLLDVAGNPIILPNGDPVKPLLHKITCPHLGPDGRLYDCNVPVMTHDPRDEASSSKLDGLPLGAELGVELQQAVDLPSPKSSVYCAPTPPPRTKKNKPWPSSWNPCTRGQPDSAPPKEDPDTSKICSVTPHLSIVSSSSSSSTSRTSEKSPFMGGLLDRIRGRKPKREPKMKRATSIPASMYSSTESLIVVQYRIRRPRNKSAPPQARKNRPTMITIDCAYGDAPAHLSPMYVTDLVGAFKQENMTAPLPDVVEYHAGLVEKIKEFKEQPATKQARETQSHVYTTCLCDDKPARTSVGIGTGCDIIQHEEFKYSPSDTLPEDVRDVSTQTDTIEEEVSVACTCELCRALAEHLEEIALTMAIGTQPVHLYVHVCQSCPLLE